MFTAFPSVKGNLSCLNHFPSNFTAILECISFRILSAVAQGLILSSDNSLDFLPKI